MTQYALFTTDVETTSIWFNALRDETGLKVMREGMPVLLDIYARHGIRSTFFFTGYIARLYPEVVRMVLKDGHEVGSHGKSHLPENSFDVMLFERQIKHLEYSKKLLEDISGQEVISFRAPALRLNRDTAKALIETGYRIDSSVASQRFDFFLSFGGLNKLKWFSAPRKPYRTSIDSIFKKGAGPLVEIPLSALFLPYVGTTMRIFPRVTSIQRWEFHWEAGLTGKPVVFDIHPNEFLDESAEARVVHRRSSNPLAYFLKDVVRSRLKVKNLGLKAVPLYEREISFYKDRGYRFTTLKDYCIETGLL
jgi:peptidoglycan-N-acetylglucosamine deacetylase